MHVLGLIVTTNNDTDKVMAEKAGTLHVWLNTHKPRLNFKDYNAVKHASAEYTLQVEQFK